MRSPSVQCHHHLFATIHPHLTGLVQQYREMFDEFRTDQSGAEPEFDRLRRREEELQREVRRVNNDRAKNELCYEGIALTWSPTNPGHQKAGN